MTFDSISQAIRRGVMLGISFTVKPESGYPVTIKQGQEIYQSTYDTIVRARTLAEKVTNKKFNGTLELEQPEPYSRISGESAGMLVTLILMSLLTGIPLRKDTTGSAAITESGQLVDVLGIREKTDAAIKAGFGRFIIAENQMLEQEVAGITLIRAKTIEEAWKCIMSNELSKLGVSQAAKPPGG